MLPQTTHTHLKYFINIQIFVVSFIFIYIYAHWRANLTSRTHLHLKRNFHAIYLHLRGNSTSYIHLGSILMPFLTQVHFLKGSLCYLSTNMHMLKGIFATHSHFARYFYAIYSHTLQGISALPISTYIHTVERYFPCYLGARYSSWGSQILVENLSNMS